MLYPRDFVLSCSSDGGGPAAGDSESSEIGLFVEVSGQRYTSYPQDVVFSCSGDGGVSTAGDAVNSEIGSSSADIAVLDSIGIESFGKAMVNDNIFTIEVYKYDIEEE